MQLSESNRIFVTLLLCTILASILRFTAVNWDQDQHLHPDERFLTMVSLDTSIPTSMAMYLNSAISTLNPRNVGYNLFVYGSFPLILNKLIATALDHNTYTLLTLQGRVLSGIFDVAVVLLIYKAATLLYANHKSSKSIGLWSAFIYAIMVTPIQMSHFFTVDTFLSTSTLSSVVFALLYARDKKLLYSWLSGISLGLGLASKLTAIFMLPLSIFFLIWQSNIDFKENLKFLSSKKIWKSLLSLTIFMITGYLTLRLSDPNIFASSNVLNPQIDSRFIDNIKELKRWENPDAMFPPAIQWITTKPFTYSAKNIALLSLGIPSTIMLIIGLIVLVRRKNLTTTIAITIIWTASVYGYQSTQFAKALRYFMILFPFFALFAGVGAQYLSHQIKSTRLQLMANIAIASTLTIWTAMFMSIYLKPHSRITASKWMYENIDPNAHLALEHWDDPLPLRLPDYSPIALQGTQLPVFGIDNPAKWSEMNQIFSSSRYYVLTSNRAWGSIPKVPDRYPQMSQFYEKLFSEKTNFTKIAEFTSYPSLKYLGIPIEFPDDWADETFTVYDHPKVIIFEKRAS